MSSHTVSLVSVGESAAIGREGADVGFFSEHPVKSNSNISKTAAYRFIKNTSFFKKASAHRIIGATDAFSFFYFHKGAGYFPSSVMRASASMTV